MKTSLAIPSFEDFESKADLESRLGRIAEWGYDAVEPMLCDPSKIDGEATRSLLESLGLGLSGLRTGLTYQREGLNLSDPDPGVRERTVRRLIEGAELAATFPGATLLNGFIQGPLQEGVDVEQACEWIAEGLGTCCERAGEIGVVVCLEAVNRYELPYNNTLADVQRILERVAAPNLLMLIDTFHMNIEEAHIGASIESFGPSVGAVHLADSNRQVPGRGHLDFGEVLRALKKIGYGGYLTVEVGPGADGDEALATAPGFIADLIASS